MYATNVWYNNQNLAFKISTQFRGVHLNFNSKISLHFICIPYSVFVFIHVFCLKLQPTICLLANLWVCEQNSELQHNLKYMNMICSTLKSTASASSSSAIRILRYIFVQILNLPSICTHFSKGMRFIYNMNSIYIHEKSVKKMLTSEEL